MTSTFLMFSFPASLLFAAEQKGLLLSCTAHLYQQSTYFDLRIQILFCIMYSTVDDKSVLKAFSAIIYSPDRRKSIHYGWISNTAKSFLENVFYSFYRCISNTHKIFLILTYSFISTIFF